MKKVAVKILTLFLIVFTINSILHKLIIPYDWGDDVLQTKNEYFNKHQDAYNTVFMGGSLFYRHIDCHQFDSLNNAQGIQTKSFNFGSDGNGHVKQLLVLKEILKKDEGKIKYIFFSLGSNSFFEKRNMHTKKFVTWMNWPSLWYTLKMAYHEDETLRYRLKLIYQYSLTYIENKLNAGLGIPLLQYKLREERKYVKRNIIELHLGENLDGYRPYYFDTDVDSSQLSNTDQILYWSHHHFKRNYDAMDTIMHNYYTDLEHYKANGAHLNKVILERYLQLIKMAEEKGIHFVAVVPARSRLPYSIPLPIYDKLPLKNKIFLGDPNEYPAFYDYDNTFNFYHMNANGAKIYTQELSIAFNELLK